MKCPNCETVLVMSDRQGIEIDYCPKCRGVWLDRGELDKIIEKSVTVSPSPERQSGYSDQQFGMPYDKHKHKHKKKGFLGELFDFD